MKKEEIKEIVYRAIREIAGTEDPFHFAVHDDMCYDIAVRAVEIAMGEEQPSEELGYIATSLEETLGTSPHSRETIMDHLKQAANWQKEQMMKSAVRGGYIKLNRYNRTNEE